MPQVTAWSYRLHCSRLQNCIGLKGLTKWRTFQSPVTSQTNSVICYAPICLSNPESVRLHILDQFIAKRSKPTEKWAEPFRIWNIGAWLQLLVVSYSLHR